MNMNKILEEFIKKYFDTKLMPGIQKNASRLQKKYGSKGSDQNIEGSYHVKSFGFQTSFMMRYMLMAFGAVCIILLIVSAAVNGNAMEGVKIFGAFFVFCLLLWIICKLKSGFIVYAPDWLYVEKNGKKREFPLEELNEIKVSGTLTLVFSKNHEPGGKSAEKIVVPLEGSQYEDFMKFLETHCPEVVGRVPEKVYRKALRKHGGSWGNRM